MPSGCADLQSCVALMAGGDTLIIQDGVYTGVENAIRQNSYPPSGSPEAYTIIKAENDGLVLFDGQGTTAMFNLNGAGPYSYLEFRGLKWGNAPYGVPAVHTYNLDHVKFLKSAAFNGGDGNASSWNITYSSYILLEDSYAWGSGRYKFVTYLSDHIIFRRTVGRLDAIDTIVPIAVYQNYCSDYVEFQNTIAIDSNESSYWTNYSYLDGAYTTHPDCTSWADANAKATVTSNTWWRGVIALNIDAPTLVLSDSVLNANFENVAAWGMQQGIIGNANNSIKINHVTLGDVFDADDSGSYGQGYGVYNWNSTLPVTNSIIYGANQYALRGVASSNYNSIYNSGTGDYTGVTAGANDFSAVNGNAIDPVDGNAANGNSTTALKYFLRVEDGSDLDSAASDGNSIGATILTKIGISGTLYGEAGYNVDTGEALWPWPNEDQIKTDFASYNPGGIDTTKPDGKRGFAADKQSLTNYIWGYLGNTVPPMNIQATPGNQKVTLTWDSPAVIALTNITGFKVYDVTGMSNPMLPGAGALVDTVSGNSTFTSTVAGLTNNTGYIFAVTAVDSGSGESSYSYLVSIVSSESSEELSGSSSGGGCFIATAAYGSYLDPNVKVLREFRDRYLLTNGPGKLIVRSYYQISPPIANFIARHETLRVTTILSLTPLVYGVKYPTVSILVLMGMAMLGIIWYVFRKKAIMMAA